MKAIKTISIALLTIALFQSCTYIKNKMNSNNVYTIPLNRYPYPISQLEKGTPLKLIAFAFGEESDKEHTYYYQFLAVNQSTGDTLRVLTPLINVGEENTYTTPTLYNHDKGIETATFIPKDSTFNMLMNLSNMGEKIMTDSSGIDQLFKKSNATEMVVMVKNVPLFERPHYKSVIGALHFDQQPW